MILQRYILRELITSFAFAFCTVLAVCLVGTMFQVVRTFPGVGVEIFAKALPLATGAMTSWIMLVASCTSSTLVYARLAAENEITAIRACGIHLWSILAPAVLLGILLVGLSYPLNEWVVPWTRYYRKVIFRDSVVFALRQPPAGQQDFRVGTTTIEYTDFLDGRMQSPTISKFKDGTLIMQCFAPLGVIEVKDAVKDGKSQVNIQVILSKPRVWQIGDPRKDAVYLKNGRKLEGKIDDRGDEIEISTPKEKVMVPRSEVDRIQRSPGTWFSAESDLTIEVPTEDVDRLPPQLPDRDRDWINEKLLTVKDAKVRNPMRMILHTRYAASIAPMLLVLVAMPIGTMVSRGSRLAGLGAALPPLLIYFISYFIFQGLGAKNRVDPLVAAYAPNVFLAALAAVLIWVGSRK